MIDAAWLHVQVHPGTHLAGGLGAAQRTGVVAADQLTTIGSRGPDFSRAPHSLPRTYRGGMTAHVDVATPQPVAPGRSRRTARTW